MEAGTIPSDVWNLHDRGIHGPVGYRDVKDDLHKIVELHIADALVLVPPRTVLPN